jgi:hypothetical protein
LADYHSDHVRFEVERSASNNEFIGIKTMNGSLSSRSYIVTDDQSLQGTKRYRLKIINEDGKINYSHAVTLYDDPQQLRISLYPNPVSDKCFVVINTVVNGNFNFVVYDVSGKTIMQWQQAIPAGTAVLPLQTSRLTNGIYFLLVNCGKSKTMIRFVKQ